MRIIVFFDLPIDSASLRKEYSRFRRFLIKDGYIMLQKSVYTKLAINQTGFNQSMERLKKNKPKSGLVQTLKVTEKQFADMEYIIGSSSHRELDTTERMVIL